MGVIWFWEAKRVSRHTCTQDSTLIDRHHSPSVSCESSYLPFMFSSDHGTNTSSSEDEGTQVSMSVKPSGRRTFDDGREVIVS